MRDIDRHPSTAIERAIDAIDVDGVARHSTSRPSPMSTIASSFTGVKVVAKTSVAKTSVAKTTTASFENVKKVRARYLAQRDAEGRTVGRWR